MKRFDRSLPWPKTLAKWCDGGLNCRNWIRHHALLGMKHQAADALSRLNTNDEHKIPLDSDVPDLTIP